MSISEKLKPLVEKLSPKSNIRQLDLANQYYKYQADYQKYGEPEARRRRHALLEMNLRSYVQEACGWQQINQYAARVYQGEAGQLKFQDTQYDDVYQGWAAALHKTTDATAKERFAQEYGSWQELWNLHTFPLAHLVGHPDQAFVLEQLTALGFHHKHGHERLTVTPGLAALFDGLHPNQRLEVWESPQPVMTASPSFPLYHQGETTVARYSKIYYLPDLNEFVILEDGFFTGYQDKEIAHFLQDDVLHQALPKSKEEFFTHFAFLDELIAFSPHAVFQHFVEQLGHFPTINIGEGVKADGLKDIDGAVQYCEAILDFEWHLCQQYPELERSLDERLDDAIDITRHHLLDSNQLDVVAHVYNYQTTYENIYHESLAKAKQRLQAKTLLTYPRMANRIYSVIDCAQGSMVGGFRGLNAFQTKFGMESFSAWQVANLRGLHSTSELQAFCQKFGLDWRRFTPGECRMCGKDTYVDHNQCQVCPVCEVGDTYGLEGTHYPELKPLTRGGAALEDEEDADNDHRSVGVQPLIASVFQGRDALLTFANWAA